MAYLHPIATVPNNLISDTTLSYTTKRMTFILLLLAGQKGRVFPSLRRIARIGLRIWQSPRCVWCSKLCGSCKLWCGTSV